uniref:Hemoglobin, linker chain 1 n=1 Tax=Macrobdella decora TaxID=6405 RepID=Q760P8_MACDE|nr:hemoglobin, linker chain 1 [Macrobdella decora]
MWKLLALCAFVAAINGSDLEDFKLKLRGGLLLHVDKGLEKLEKQLEKHSKFHPDDIYQALAQRVQDAEEHCEYGYFQCGGNYLQCLDSVKVCDGVKDCFNGHDEDADVCYKEFLAPGTQFSLRLSWTSCENWADKHYDVHLRQLHRSKTFAGNADVVVDLVSQDHQHRLVLKGRYTYGKKELLLLSDHPKLKGYQFVCDFFDGKKGRAKCYIETKSSLFPCGTGFLLEK